MHSLHWRNHLALRPRPFLRPGAALAVGALLAGALVVAAPTPAPASTPDPVVVNADNPISGDGLAETTPFVFEVAVTCNSVPHEPFVSGAVPQDDLLLDNRFTMLGIPLGTPFVPFDSWVQVRATVENCAIPGFRDVPLVDWNTLERADQSVPPETVPPTQVGGNVFAATFQVTQANDNIRFNVSGNPFVAVFILQGADPSSGSGGTGDGGGGSCVMPPLPLSTYVTPELWAVNCDSWQQPSDGTLVLDPAAGRQALDYRITVPAGVSGIRITTTGSMRYSAPAPEAAFPQPCGDTFGSNAPVPSSSPSTGFDGTADCPITFTTPTSAPTTVFMPGRVIVPDAGSFTLTFTLLDGATVVDTYAYTIVKGAGSSGGDGTVGTTSGTAQAEDPIDADVAAAVAQSAAAGVAGTSSSVLLLGGQIVPVTSTISSGAGPRGGVVLEAEGLKVTVASAVGARPDSGVVVPTGGEMQCSLCGGFVPGTVVEAWVNSDPRLTAAVRIPDDAEADDCHLLAIPTGAPLDGRGAIEAGAHTLQLRMHTDAGFAVLSTGITIGAVSPTRIPAGEGAVPFGGALMLLLATAGLGLVVVRRQVVSG